MLKKLFPYGFGIRKQTHIDRGVINQTVYNKPLYRRSELGYVVDRMAPVIETFSDDKITLNVRNVASDSSFSITALERNTKRRYLYFKNIDNAASIFVGFGSSVLNVASSNFELLPGEEREYSTKVPIDSIHIRSLLGSPVLVIGEGV
jgi:hypothetical protein